MILGTKILWYTINKKKPFHSKTNTYIPERETQAHPSTLCELRDDAHRNDGNEWQNADKWMRECNKNNQMKEKQQQQQ